MSVIVALGVAFVTAPLALAQQENSYVHTESIGASNLVKCPTEPLTFLPIDCWVGKKIVFLPKRMSSQEHGYFDLQKVEVAGAESVVSQKPKKKRRTPKKPAAPQPPIPRGVPYAEVVGQVGTIVEIQENPMGVGMVARQAIVDIEGGKRYSSRVNGLFAGEESIPDTVFVEDLEAAKEKWLGKTLWFKSRRAMTYDANTDKIGFFEVENYSPVEIVEIVAGWYTQSPIRFIFRTTGDAVGFIDVNLSGTNISTILRDNSLFDQYFSEIDPREQHDWSLTRPHWSYHFSC